MRSFFTFLASGLVLVLISSCATVPSEPLKPGEVRLLRVQAEGNPTMNLASRVRISFVADGKPEIRRVCLTWSGEGRSCVKASHVEYGSPGEIMVLITPRLHGMFVLECYAEYTREGKAWPSNKVSTQATVTPY